MTESLKNLLRPVKELNNNFVRKKIHQGGSYFSLHDVSWKIVERELTTLALLAYILVNRDCNSRSL